MEKFETESFKIENRKYLDKNNYDKVLIDLASSTRRIKFFGKDLSKSKMRSPKFTDDLLRTNAYKADIQFQDEVVLGVLDHFLSYTTINSIETNKIVKRYEGYWDIIQSNDRELMIKMAGFFSRDIIKKIHESYYFNRSKYCFNKDNEISAIHLTKNSEYFGKEIGLRVKKDGSLSIRDSEFLIDLLEDRLDYEHEARMIYENHDIPRVNFYVGSSCYVICGDLKIKVDEGLDYIIGPTLLKYNNEVKETKGKQLILEGFRRK